MKKPARKKKTNSYEDSMRKKKKIKAVEIQKFFAHRSN
jgi:hypothetical protein